MLGIFTIIGNTFFSISECQCFFTFKNHQNIPLLSLCRNSLVDLVCHCVTLTDVNWCTAYSEHALLQPFLFTYINISINTRVSVVAWRHHTPTHYIHYVQSCKFWHKANICVCVCVSKVRYCILIPLNGSHIAPEEHLTPSIFSISCFMQKLKVQ